MTKLTIKIVAIIAICVFVLSSCGKTTPGDNNITWPNDNNSTDVNPTDVNPTVVEPTVDDSTKDVVSGYIKKVQCAAEKAGIYALIITLDSSKIADNGTLEYLYYGSKGSAQEGVVVCTYVSNYTKLESGKYDVHCFYDGKVDMNHYGLDEIKVNCTFGALVRAEYAIISYTPEGGEKQEIGRIFAENHIPKS